MKAPTNNHHANRETWLDAATSELRPFFAKVGYPLPDNIRIAIAFTSTGRKRIALVNAGIHPHQAMGAMRSSFAPISMIRLRCWVC